MRGLPGRQGTREEEGSGRLGGKNMRSSHQIPTWWSGNANSPVYLEEARPRAWLEIRLTSEPELKADTPTTLFLKDKRRCYSL